MSRRSKMRNQTKNHTKRRLPGWLMAVLIVGAALLALAVLDYASKSNANQPAVSIEVHGRAALKVDKDKIDFGNVALGQMVSASFEVINVGDQPLVFSEPPYIQVVEGC